MSFLSTLGKIAGIAGPLVAAPFTGGTSLLGLMGVGGGTASAIGAGLGAAGKLASGASAQRAADRGAQTEYDLINDRTRLEGSRFNQGVDRQRLAQMLGADLLSTQQAPTDPRATKFATGATVSPETIAAIRQQASRPNYFATTPQAKPTGMDSFLSALSLGGTAAGALDEFLRRQKAAQAPVNVMPQARINDQFGNVRF